MRKGLVLLAATAALAAAAFYGLKALVAALRVRGGFWHEVWRALYGAPPTLQRGLIAWSLALLLAALLLTPLALAERRSAKAYERALASVQAERPLAAPVPYEGPEGEGVAFEGPEGRALVLRGAHGVGGPIVVREDAASDVSPDHKTQYLSPD